MRLTLASYNIHFGVGQDGRYDTARLAEAVRDADILCLQEVVQNWPQTGYEDQLRTLGERLNLHAVSAPVLSLDASEVDAAGRIRDRRATFGNAVLSRWPIRHARTLPLPKNTPPGEFDLQRVVLEAVIDTPALPLRIYCVHLSDHSPAQRRPQVEALRRFVAEAPVTGRPWDHRSAFLDFLGHGAFEMPAEAALLGDFNLGPDEDNYARLLEPLPGGPVLADAWALAAPPGAPGRTYCYGDSANERIDHCFLSEGLAARLDRCWIDSSATGSDHYPLFVSLEF